MVSTRNRDKRTTMGQWSSNEIFISTPAKDCNFQWKNGEDIMKWWEKKTKFHKNYVAKFTELEMKNDRENLKVGLRSRKKIDTLHKTNALNEKKKSVNQKKPKPWAARNQRTKKEEREPVLTSHHLLVSMNFLFCGGKLKIINGELCKWNNYING